MTPVVTRSGSRRTGMSGAFALLEADEQMVRSLVTGPAADGDPEPPAALACDLKTPDAYVQAHAGPHGRIWGVAERKEFAGLKATGTFKPVGEEWQRRANIVTAKWVYKWKTDEFCRVVRTKGCVGSPSKVSRSAKVPISLKLFPRARQSPVSACWLGLRVSQDWIMPFRRGAGFYSARIEGDCVHPSAVGMRLAFRYACQTRSKLLRLEAGITHVARAIGAGYGASWVRRVCC